jgi:hypothetical protein
LRIALIAFTLRAGAAVLTEYRDILPAYHFTDALLMERWGWELAESTAAGRPRHYARSPSQRVMIALAANVYRTGHHPLFLKLLCCAVASSAVALLWLLAAPIFGTTAATLAAVGLAVWPSAAFYGSQFLKDGLIMAPLYAGLLLALLPSLTPATVMGALLALVGVGCLRSYALIPAAAALAAAAAAYWRSKKHGKGGALLALAIATPLAYKLASTVVLDRISPVPAETSDSDPSIRAEIIPTSYDGKTHYTPYTPEGLTRFRHYRQQNDQVWALQNTGRRIETQIYPDAEFKTWLDVALFVPKSAFHALFMPLPGLYPLNGKLTRLLAGLENILLLAMFALALSGLRRGPWTAERVALLVFVGVMIAGTALIEFDLGAASRHKTLFLPLLFPFAAEELLRFPRRRGGKP